MWRTTGSIVIVIVIVMKERYFTLLVCALLVAMVASWALKRVLLTAPVQRRQRARLADLQTGDLLLWSGWLGHPVHDAIKLATGCEFTHCGILFIDAAGKPFVWEIRRARRPTLNPLFTRLGEPTTCVVRHLHHSLPMLTMAARFERAMAALAHHRYSMQFWKAVASTWALPVPPPAQDRGALFCSELAAATYAALGALSLDQHPASTTLVCHLTQQHQRLDMQAGFALGPELQLTD